jgi:glutamate-ammonia-ligase adenylyltransferase
MIRNRSPDARAEAVQRAGAHSPFLRDGIRARAELVDRFLAAGAEAAAALALQSAGEGIDVTLRRRRHGLALAVALGDLAG